MPFDPFFFVFCYLSRQTGGWGGVSRWWSGDDGGGVEPPCGWAQQTAGPCWFWLMHQWWNWSESELLALYFILLSGWIAALAACSRAPSVGLGWKSRKCHLYKPWTRCQTRLLAACVKERLRYNQVSNFIAPGISSRTITLKLRNKMLPKLYR